MIFSSIYANDNVKNYPEAIQKAISYVTNTDFSQLEDGVYEIDADVCLECGACEGTCPVGAPKQA